MSVVCRTTFISVSTLGTITMVFKAGDEMFKVTKYQMLLTGVWPLKSDWSTRSRVLYNIYGVLVATWGGYGTPLLTGMLFFKCLAFENNMRRTMENLSYFVLTLLASVKLYCGRTQDMTDMLRQAIDDANRSAENDPNVTAIWRKYSRYSLVLNTVLWTVNVSLTTIFDILLQCGVNDYIRHHPDGSKPLHLLIHWYPFDMSKYFNIAFGSQQISAFLFGFYNSMTQSLIVTIMIYCSAQLEVERTAAAATFCCDESPPFAVNAENRALRRLKGAVVQHENTIKYVNRLNESIQYVMLFEYNMTSFLLASVLFKILHGETVVFNMYYLIVVTFQLLCLCYNANEIMVQSIAVGAALYESKWYQCRKKAIHQLVMIVLSRSKKPLYLTVGPFGPITASTGLGRLKLAYSYASIMSGIK